jgi:ABC-type hemin transport system substrate-binding protein
LPIEDRRLKIEDGLPAGRHHRVWLGGVFGLRSSFFNLALAAGFVVVSAFACRPPATAPSSTEPAASAAPPQRIVSLAPSVTEVLFALGLGDRVVGVTSFCRYPPEAARLP